MTEKKSTPKTRANSLDRSIGAAKGKFQRNLRILAYYFSLIDDAHI